MPKNLRYSKSHMKSQMRSAGRKADRELKRGLRKSGQQFKREMDKSQHDLQRQIKRAESNLNRELRKYNESTRRIINNESRKLGSLSNNEYVRSTQELQRKYNAVNKIYPETCEIDSEQARILDLIDIEQATGLITANVIETNEAPEENTEDCAIGNKLLLVSEDLNNRWNGALYALNPNNPEAARQFCTSAREILTYFIDIKAPDKDVIEFNPKCKRCDNSDSPTRREKIRFMLHKKEMDICVVDYTEADINNILDLIYQLSGGTHGPSGTYDYEVLLQLKKRVEQGINFLCEISS